MKVESIEIKDISGGSLKGNFEGIKHIKSLPYFSVVQSVYGYYEIGLDGEDPYVTKEGDAFLAPANTIQHIVHHNGITGYMEAHWAFMNIIINDIFAFEDVFDIPTLISAHYFQEVFQFISTIRNDSSICQKYAAAYQLTDILISHSSMKEGDFDESVAFLKKYIDENYRKKITKEDLANVAICSVPNLYRLFNRHFHMSPHNYVNKIRLQKAAVLLKNNNYTVTEVSEAVGFDDPVYFSKLFKKSYQLSPKKYRELSKSLNSKDTK